VFRAHAAPGAGWVQTPAAAMSSAATSDVENVRRAAGVFAISQPHQHRGLAYALTLPRCWRSTRCWTLAAVRALSGHVMVVRLSAADDAAARGSRNRWPSSDLISGGSSLDQRHPRSTARRTTSRKPCASAIATTAISGPSSLPAPAAPCSVWKGIFLDQPAAAVAFGAPARDGRLEHRAISGGP